MKNILIVIVLFWCYSVLAGEHPVFTHISSNEGLSENHVRVLSQLPDGRMVIITEGLVNIYDGAGFHYIHFNDEKAYSLGNYTGYHHAYIDTEGHLWLKNYKKLLLFDIEKEQFVPAIDSLLALHGITKEITDFFMDSQHNFWYVTADDHLIYRNVKDKKNKNFLNDVSLLNHTKDQLYDIALFEKQAFLFYKSGWMVCFDMLTTKEIYRNKIFADLKKNVDLNTLMVVPFKHYLYSLQNCNGIHSMHRFDINERKWEKVLQTDYWLNTLTIDEKGNSWVSCAKGIWQISSDLKEKNFISRLQLVGGEIFETEISTQYNDDKGGLWIGTFNRGLLYYHPERFKFRNFGRSLFNNVNGEELQILSLSEKNKDVYIATSKGLFFYPPNAQYVERYPNIPANVNCKMLFRDSKERIWLFTTNSGVYSIENNDTRHYKLPEIETLAEMPDGLLYLYTRQGIFAFNPESGEYNSINTTGPEIRNFHQVVKYNNDTLIGLSGSGIFIVDNKKNKISLPAKEAPGKRMIFPHSNHQYNCILVDSRNLIWLGTQDGLNVWDNTRNCSRAFFMEDGLTNNCIQSIIEDNQHRIWVSTSNGITRIEVAKKDTAYEYAFVNFNRYDGVINNEFMPRSVFLTSDNRLLWGGLDGFNEINLNLIDASVQQLSIPLFTRLFLSGVEIRHGQKHGGRVILQQAMVFTREIRLKHFENFVNLEFSALNYINPTQTYYRYRMEGIDNSWHEIKTNDGIGRAGYTNLPPGTYRLKVEATNNGRRWNNKYAELTIIIDPPFWKTPYAYIIYILTFVCILYFSLFYYTRRKRLELQRQQKEELDQLKFSFFTNISHELRTPLTLILTPLDSIIKKTSDVRLKSQLTGIYRNAGELLKLVNQLLDFRKLEIKGESLHLSYCNIGEFLKSIILPFEELLIDKGIKFVFDCREGNLHAYIDRDKLQKIVSNLLSNAYKFTPAKGSISVLFDIQKNVEETSFLKIQVADTGCGIPSKELTRVFERFFQVKDHSNNNTGSGIGLHLVKEYVHLHGGEISVQSIINKGSTFTVFIPADLHPSDEDMVTTEKKNHNGSLKLLVVEDNEEFRAFLCSELSESYSVNGASDGKEGLRKVKEYAPDLIISDLMMPGITGTELCRTLKNDLQTSHIPIIMLTARASDSAQIEVLESGADAFISKPFNMEILQLRIHNLLEQQEHRRNLYRKAIIINPGSLTSTNIDEEFIKKAVAFIEKNMDNPSYLVEELSKDMCMDRTGLYRKLIAIVGQKPSSFIRSVRLKRAAQLIVKGVPVSEVAENVGYGTTSYFSRCFQEEFGVPPSQYKEE